MHYAQRRSPGSNAIGISLVVLLHLGVGYALLQSLATQTVNKVPPPLIVRPVDEPKPKIEPPPPIPQAQIEHPILNYRPKVEFTITPPPVPVSGPIVITTPPVGPIVEPGHAPSAAPPADTQAGAKRLAGPPLHFPARLVREGMQGWVDVQCDIDDVGGTSNCAMVGHDGALGFVDEALDYVRASRYSPATRNGIAVTEKNHRFNITFKLTDR